MAIDNDTLVRMYRTMLTIRRFEERASKEFKAGAVPGLVTQQAPGARSRPRNPHLGFLRGPAVTIAHGLDGLVKVRPEQGARTAVYLATSAEVEGVTGAYFEKEAAVPSSAESYDAVAASRLWEVSAQLTGLNAATG